MSDLQEFNKLFTVLEDRVVALDKREAEATRNIKTSEARYTFLKDEIKKLEQQRDQHVESHIEAVKQAKTAQETANQDLANIETAGLRLKAQHEQKNKVLVDQLAVLETRLSDTNHNITAARQVIAGLTEQKTNLLAEIERLKQTIVSKKFDIEQVEENLIKQKTNADEELLAIKNSIDTAKRELSEVIGNTTKAHDELSEVNLKIKTAGSRLGETNKAHDKLLKQDQERSKALDIREAALTEQERQLEVRIITSRRRNPALEKTA